MNLTQLMEDKQYLDNKMGHQRGKAAIIDKTRHTGMALTSAFKDRNQSTIILRENPLLNIGV